jgi:hypothetical protein
VDFYEMLILIEQRGEKVVKDSVSELVTDKHRYVRAVEGGKYVWVTWTAHDQPVQRAT